MRLALTIALCCCVYGQVPERIRQGHSHLLEAFNAGPHEKPWDMQGIGAVDFPISTQNKEAQKWFDQGVTLAHNFWWYEAERSFRWARKLDPDHPMPYWGLALASQDEDRSAAFLQEAEKRIGRASPREKLWIAAYRAYYARDPLQPKQEFEERNRKFREAMETLILRHPEDMEAKAFLGLSLMGDDRMGAELLLQQVLKKYPDHPGAHHYRIHNWNYHEPEASLDSCKRYGEIGWDTGHALHMPGHIYSTVGMWQEAAISMDAATRSEARYMKERLVLPFNAWNYAHNKDYLCRIQEQLGMQAAALDGARQLMAAAGANSKSNRARQEGVWAFVRNHLKFERWKEYLAEEDKLPWRDDFFSKVLRTYARARAELGLNQVDKALETYDKYEQIRKEVDKNKGFSEGYEAFAADLKGRLLLARGEILDGLTAMAAGAARQFSGREPDEVSLLRHPVILWNGVGEAYLAHRSPALAISAFGKALKITRNDGFALSGLVRAHHALGETAQAQERLAQLLYVWSDADRGLRPLEKALATGLMAKPKGSVPAPERSYATTSLAKFGPNRWEPYAAPLLDARDTDGKRVTLDEYRGKNVLLVFYLGDECPHCVQQLVGLGKRRADFQREDTVLLAVSKDTPAENKESLALGEVPFRLLSDTQLENAKRFRSYDDFESIEVHATILIDRQGRVHWAHTGGDPFTDFDFLLQELKQLNAQPYSKRPRLPAGAQGICAVYFFLSREQAVSAPLMSTALDPSST